MRLSYECIANRILDNILKLAEEFVSVNDSSQREVAIVINEFRSLLMEFHSQLNIYRIHEARENYKKELKENLARLKELEKVLESKVTMYKNRSSKSV